MFVCMIYWGTTLNQRHTRHHHSTKGLRVMSACACVCADSCRACRVTKVDKPKTDTVIHIHSPKRWKPGKNAGWQGRQLVAVQIKRPASRRNRELGRHLSGSMFVCMIVWGARANQGHTRHHHSSRVCEWSLHVCQKRKEISTHAHARVHACAHRSSTTSQGCTSVNYMCECVCCYYFANPSTVSLCLPVHVRPCVLMLVYTILSWYLFDTMCNKHFMLGQTAVIYTHTYTHLHTFNTFTQAQHSVNSHEKRTHSLKHWKPGKNVGWQGRKLVVVQWKIPVSRRNRE